jgi:pimeloyl-ACP methyl ester carboxylesterase
MSIATLHDGSSIEVTILGSGHPVLLPVSLAVADGETAERMRAWGADPSLGHTLAHAVADAGFRVLAADYEGHLQAHPKPATLTADAVAHDLLAIADAGGAGRFAYYGYSVHAVNGLQLAIRSDRVSALAMGGFPPLGGPYPAMLEVTRAAHRMAVENEGRPPQPASEVPVGDWEAAEVTQSAAQTGQFVTLYESLRGFDERAALEKLETPRLAFAGVEDNIDYGPRWGNVRVELGAPLVRHRDELVALGWTVEAIPGADHMVAMQAARVAPILIPWLRSALG